MLYVAPTVTRSMLATFVKTSGGKSIYECIFCLNFVSRIFNGWVVPNSINTASNFRTPLESSRIDCRCIRNCKACSGDAQHICLAVTFVALGQEVTRGTKMVFLIFRRGDVDFCVRTRRSHCAQLYMYSRCTLTEHDTAGTCSRCSLPTE